MYRPTKSVSLAQLLHLTAVAGTEVLHTATAIQRDVFSFLHAYYRLPGMERHPRVEGIRTLDERLHTMGRIRYR